MADYKKLCNILIGELSDIIDKAKNAIAIAEQDILSEDKNSLKVLKFDKNDNETDDKN